MKLAKLVTFALLLLSWASSGWSNPWDLDMVDQPSPKPQKSLAPPQPNAIPIYGGETVPAPTTEDGLFAAKDEAAMLVNPVPAGPESVARGQELYMTICLVCHGPEGRGDGPVGQLFENWPLDLTDAYIQDQADGQIFFTLTRGGMAMPFYRDALSQHERWDVINFLRKEFAQQ